MKELQFLNTNLVAHRGLHNKEVLENTIESFANAVNSNYIIEFDVHLLKDNNIIVFHDDNLNRLANIDRKIKDLTLEEVKKIKLVGNYKIPTIEEALNLINGKVPIIIELKSDQKPGKLEKKLVKYLDTYKGKFVVKSFNPLIIRWFKKNRPNYIRGLLLSSKRSFLCKLCLTNFAFNLCKPDFLSLDKELLNHKIMKKEIFKLCYTIKSKEEYEKYKKYYDNLICENILEKNSKIIV